MATRRGWAISALVTVFAAGLVFYRLNISLWYDEAWSYGLSTQPWHVFLGHYLWGVEANMALYYGILRVWLAAVSIFGIHPVEVIVRLPSAAFAIASTFVVYQTGRRFFSSVAGLIAAALFATNFLQLLLAQDARSYSLQLLLLGVSWYCLLTVLQGRTDRRWWAGYMISSALSVYAALFSVLVLAAQLAAFFVLLLWPGSWQGFVRRSLRPMAVSVLSIGVLCSPILLDAVLHGGPNNWVPPAHLTDVRNFLLFISGGNVWYERLLLASALLGIGLTVAAWASPRRLRPVSDASPETLATVIALGCWVALPIVVSFALTRPSLNLHLFFQRYLIVVIPAICLLSGIGVAALRWRAAQLALALLLALVAWPQVPAYYAAAQSQDFHDPTLWIQQHFRAGDGLICDPAVECGVPMGYYLAAYPGPAHFDWNSPGLFIWSNTSWIPVNRGTVLAYAGQHRRVFLIFGPLGNGAGEAAEGQGLVNALSSHYRKLAQMTAHATAADASVFLYQVRS